MIPEASPLLRRINWPRVAAGGLAAGLMINVFDYAAHRVVLDNAWRAAFHALGKSPAGWWSVVLANFVVGVLMVWLYARLRPTYGAGLMSALRPGVAIWAVFWAIPMMALMPMDLFPNWLLATVIALGFVEVNLAALFGAWLYKKA